MVAGDRGMVGSALMRRLESENCTLVGADRSDVNFTRQAETENYITQIKPYMVILAAAKVGGILANADAPADFLTENIQIQTNVMEAARLAGAQKFLFLGSSCIYPKETPQPMKEEYLLSSALEPTNEAYALAKIAGVKACQYYRQQYGLDYIAAMPCNLYGHGDNFDPQTSHVIPALIRRIHEAKVSGVTMVPVWGTGKPRREFLYVDDLANGLVFLLKNYQGEQHINVGAGQDISIAELARTIADVVGYEGDLYADETKPDGTMLKLMDSSRMKIAGWSPSISLKDGLEKTYAWFVEHQESLRHAA